MKITAALYRPFSLFICLFTVLGTAFSQNSQTEWIGFWKGDLNVGAANLQLIIEVKKQDGTENLKSSLDVPAQGAKGISFDKTEINKQNIFWNCDMIRASCSGEKTDSITIKAVWKQGGKEFPLTLKKSTERYSNKPQTPKPPYGYITKTAQFGHPSGKLVFGGTLTIPNDSLFQLFEKNKKEKQEIETNTSRTPSEFGKHSDRANLDLNNFIGARIVSKPYTVRGKVEGVTRYPVVLLISGSGSQDRDESIGDHKPFAVWADYLSLRGIAALRVDDRGMNASKGEPGFLETTTTESLVEDALAAIAWLKTQPDIDTNFIFLMGHSEGASIALKAAKKSNNIRGVISLSGMVEKGIETSIYQLNPIWKSNGASESTIQSLAQLTRKCAAASAYIKTEEAAKKFVKDSMLKIAQYQEAFKYVKKFEVKQTKQPNLESYLAKRIAGDYQQPWIQYFIQYDPKLDFDANEAALLMIQGQKDMQINAIGAKAMATHLESEGKYVQYKEFPRLNHLLQHANTGGIDEYFTLEETLAREVPATVFVWLNTQLTGR